MNGVNMVKNMEGVNGNENRSFEEHMLWWYNIQYIQYNIDILPRPNWKLKEKFTFYNPVPFITFGCKVGLHSMAKKIILGLFSYCDMILELGMIILCIRVFISSEGCY